MHMSDELVDWFNQDGHFAATAAATTALVCVCSRSDVEMLDAVDGRAP
jgi:hypothetical protein